MDKSGKFLLPSPKFHKLEKTPTTTPHFLSAQGMLLPKEQQPPPMYGPRGSTVPPKFLGHQQMTAHHHPDRTQKFYCDPCEAEFHTSTDFKVHRSEHVQCEIDNCSFWGHPSFMDTHIGLQHATGLYSEIKKLSTPEEIAEWRAQRKKNYPTVAVVLQKQKAKEQRMLRGEKLEAKKTRFGNREDRRQIRTEQQGEAPQSGGKKHSKRQNRKRNRFGKPVTENEVKKEEVPVKSVEEEAVEPAVCGGLKMFTGTGGMADYKKVKKVESHALTGLLGMYGSGSEDEEDNSDDESVSVDKPKPEILIKDNKEAPSSQERTTTTQAILKEGHEKVNGEDAPLARILTAGVQDTSNSHSQNTSDPPAPQESDNVKLSEEAPTAESVPEEPQTEIDLNAQQNSDDEGPEEVPIEKSSNTSASLQSTPEEVPVAMPSNVPVKPTAPPKKVKKLPPKKKTRHYGLDYKKLRVGRQNTLLEKLLEANIRHERNVLLQCVRFVVQNNFFGIGSPKSQPDA